MGILQQVPAFKIPYFGIFADVFPIRITLFTPLMDLDF